MLKHYAAYGLVVSSIVGFLLLTAAVIVHRNRKALVVMLVLATFSVSSAVAFSVVYATRKRPSLARSAREAEIQQVHPLVLPCKHVQEQASSAPIRMHNVLHRKYGRVASRRVRFRNTSEEREYIRDDPPPVMSPSFASSTRRASSTGNHQAGAEEGERQRAQVGKEARRGDRARAPRDQPHKVGAVRIDISGDDLRDSIAAQRYSHTRPDVEEERDNALRKHWQHQQQQEQEQQQQQQPTLLQGADDVNQFMNELHVSHASTAADASVAVIDDDVKLIPMSSPVQNGKRDDVLEQFMVRRPRNAAEIMEARERHLKYRFNPEHLKKALVHDRLYGIGEGKSAKDGLKHDSTYEAIRITRDEYEKFLLDRKDDDRATQ